MSVASAAPVTPSSPPAVSTPAAPSTIGGEIASTSNEVNKIQSEFAQKGVVPTVTDNGTVLRKSYSEGSGKVVTVTTEPAPPKPGRVQPRVSIGFGTGVYVTLTHAEQNALLVGGTGLVVGLICDATGGIACVVAVPIVGAAVAFVTSRGVCPNNGELEVKISYSGSISGVKCK